MAIARKPTGLRLLVEKVIDKSSRSKKDQEALKQNALQNRAQQANPDDANALNRMSEMIAATRSKQNKKSTKKSSA